MAITSNDINDLCSALRQTLSRCQYCDEFATWSYDDEDGEEFVCDAHKLKHFYGYGPYEIEFARDAIETLRRICEKRLEAQ